MWNTAQRMSALEASTEAVSPPVDCCRLHRQLLLLLGQKAELTYGNRSEGEQFGHSPGHNYLNV